VGLVLNDGPATLEWLTDVVCHLHFTATGTAELIIAINVGQMHNLGSGSSSDDCMVWHRLTAGLISPTTAHFDRDGHSI
jgi:hypothetical protein